MSNLVDIGDVPALDVWGDTVQARVVAGANASLALVELAPGAIVTLDVGSRRFRLGGAGDSAWGTDGINASANIVAAMRGSDTMTVGARDMQGRFFRDSYSLRGAPTAIDAAIVACR